MTRELWATNNGRDWAGNDTPHDTLHRIRRPGEDHGFPFCVGEWNDPAAERRQCSEFEQPAASLGPHTAPLGARFYTGFMFPEGAATSSSSRGAGLGTASSSPATTWSWRGSARTAPWRRWSPS